MPKKESPLIGLKEYLPDGSFEAVLHYLQHHKVHLTITKQRQSVLGDYRHAHLHKTHRISVNGNLNKFSFLITFEMKSQKRKGTTQVVLYRPKVK